MLHRRDPSRDTVLYPAVSYPTYAMGAELAGCRAVPVPLDDDWHLDLSAVSEEDAARALLLWLNEPGNPTGSQSAPGPLAAAVDWARTKGVIVASDECYVEFNWDTDGDHVPGATALTAGVDGVLAVHSLSKRSNMAGYRCGFVAGDGDLVAYIGSIRTHAGMMVPGPIQGAATAAWNDDAHVDGPARPLRRAAQLRPRPPGRRRSGRRRRAVVVLPLGPVHRRRARTAGGSPPGWPNRGCSSPPAISTVSGGTDFVRIALVQPLERLEMAFDRLSLPDGPRTPAAADRSLP